YVSVSDVLSPDQVKQRQDEENRRQQEWDATHPVEAAERNYERARAELNQANEDVARNQERQAKAVQVYNSRKSELDAANKTLADAIAEIKQFNRFAHDPMAGGHRMWQMAGLKAQRAQTDVNNKQAAFDAAAKEKSDADAALSSAMESRKKKEDKKRSAENKLNEEKNKPRKGVKDYGHDYHPAPKTEEIKGLGELKKAPKKTPKQGGGGRRDRWIGDKGRKIYEWDSQHGELEGYRASDGEHLGAFDPKTGKQIKGPDPKGRNIKKYL
ncbi:colicin E3/pyocin S6 family cytotoxin, partial [Escherichia coli]|nr:colicin [Escherichia coli]